MNAEESFSLAPLTRRTLLRQAGAGAFGVSAASLLAACGGSSSSGSSGGGSTSEAITGQAILANYPGWMGKHNLADFAKKYPGASIKMISNATSSSAEVVLQFKSKQYDFLLADTSDAGQAAAANLITELDWSKIPNVKNVAPSSSGRRIPGACRPTTARSASPTAPTWSAARRSRAGTTCGS